MLYMYINKICVKECTYVISLAYGLNCKLLILLFLNDLLYLCVFVQKYNF